MNVSETTRRRFVRDAGLAIAGAIVGGGTLAARDKFSDSRAHTTNALPQETDDLIATVERRVSELRPLVGPDFLHPDAAITSRINGMLADREAMVAAYQTGKLRFEPYQATDDNGVEGMGREYIFSFPNDSTTEVSLMARRETYPGGGRKDTLYLNITGGEDNSGLITPSVIAAPEGAIWIQLRNDSFAGRDGAETTSWETPTASFSAAFSQQKGIRIEAVSL